jgi:Zn-dependent M28 family amino/carboxypeptidase
MLVMHSKNRWPRKSDANVATRLREVSAERLRHYVEMLAFPRHYLAERHANVRARDLLLRLLANFGYSRVVLVGDYDNIVVTTGEGPYLLLGAHYDSVPGTPGADDNGSAVAVCLECARLLRDLDGPPVMIVFFNREEDGLLGSREFVASLKSQSKRKIDEAHVFEMVGYCTHAANSQRMPPGLPGIAAPKVGDFLGLLANRGSNAIAEQLLRLAATYVPESRVIALKIYFGLERQFDHLHRSDHAPFWQAGIPSVMWTDTAEFRNPHYHQATDTPETLDYDFLAQVTRLALARALTKYRGNELPFPV